MKKLKLDLDDLKVESFQTTPGAQQEGQGTVQGYITQDLTLCEECTSPDLRQHLRQHLRQQLRRHVQHLRQQLRRHLLHLQLQLQRWVWRPDLHPRLYHRVPVFHLYGLPVLMKSALRRC